MQRDGLHHPHGEITPCSDKDFSKFIKETLSKNLKYELIWFGSFLIQFNKTNYFKQYNPFCLFHSEFFI